MDDSKAVLVITPALVYDMKGEVYALPADIVHADNHFTVLDGSMRECSGERSFMYSLGVYVVPWQNVDDKHTSTSAWRTPRAEKTRVRFSA